MTSLVRAAVLALTLTGSAAYVHIASKPANPIQKSIITGPGYPRPTCMPKDYKDCPL